MVISYRFYMWAHSANNVFMATRRQSSVEDLSILSIFKSRRHALSSAWINGPGAVVISLCFVFSRMFFFSI